MLVYRILVTLLHNLIRTNKVWVVVASMIIMTIMMMISMMKVMPLIHVDDVIMMAFIITMMIPVMMTMLPPTSNLTHTPGYRRRCYLQRRGRGIVGDCGEAVGCW